MRNDGRRRREGWHVNRVASKPCGSGLAGDSLAAARARPARTVRARRTRGARPSRRRARASPAGAAAGEEAGRGPARGGSGRGGARGSGWLCGRRAAGWVPRPRHAARLHGHHLRLSPEGLRGEARGVRASLLSGSLARNGEVRRRRLAGTSLPRAEACHDRKLSLVIPRSRPAGCLLRAKRFRSRVSTRASGEIR
jgi:hypothetical protein